ncbi:MAG: acyloxyacyl hydrolase [Bacteroidales bacterium]
MMMVLCSAILLSAQDKQSGKSYLSLGLRPHYGFVLIHSRDIRYVKDSYPQGLEFDVSWHYSGQKAYYDCLCMPRLGVSLTYWDFDNPEVLGQGLVSQFFVEPFYGSGRRFSFSFRAGTGLAYINRPYDSLANPNNLSYSTRINFTLNLSSTLNYVLSERVQLNLSANYNHISNGGMNEPNKGINYPTASIGVDYYLRDPEFPDYPKHEWQGSSGQNAFFFHLFGTAKQLSGSGETNRYPVAGLAVRFSRQVSRLNALNIGVEVVSDGAHREAILRSGRDTDHKQAGLLVGNEFILGRFLFSQQFGVYIYDPYQKNSSLFQHYALDMKIFSGVLLGIGLKAHGHVADFLSFRIGLAL